MAFASWTFIIFIIFGNVCYGQRARIRQCRTWALCPLTPQEVCGTDDKTYTNDCFLRKQTCLSGGLTKLKHRGPCGTGLRCRRVCPLTYEPLCGSDGVTYGNPCILEQQNCFYGKNVVKKSDGKCWTYSKTSCGIRCSQRRQKICASDKKTYNAMCEFEEAKCSDGSLKIFHYGKCKTAPVEECIKSCSNAYKPVCGTDNKNYFNLCTLSRETCKNSNIQLKYYGTCESCSKTCPRQKTFVCGSDGRTYDQCEIEKIICRKGYDYVTIKYSGRCVTCNKPCGNIIKPICGSDGRTYNSECELENINCENRRNNRAVIEKSYDGRCLNGAELCLLKVGTANECAIKSWLYTYDSDTGECKRFYGCRNQHANSFMTKADCEGRCRPKCEEECPENLELFVCGTNGVTYKNACYLNRASCFAWGRIQLAHSGVCGGQQA